jgi:hypothetical protein
MALGNFIITGSYTNIHDIQYCKHSNSLTFTIKTYETSSKTLIINEQRKYLNFNIVLDVKSITLATPPSEPTLDYYYVVPQNATGDWASLVGNIVQWDGNAWLDHGNQAIYVEDSSKYMEMKDGVWAENVRLFDLRKFNQFFAIEKIGYENSSDIIKQIYTYLKTLPEYALLLDV